MVDKVRARVLEQQVVRTDEELRKTIEDLRHGNIHEVLSKAKIPAAEIQKFFANQWQQWQSQIVQNYETYATEGALPPPVMAEFNDTDPHNAFRPGDGALILEGMLATGKAAVTAVKDAGTVSVESGGVDTALSGESGEGVLTLGEVEAMAEDTLAEWEGFMGELWSSVLDAQMVRDYEARMSEIKKEVERIIALAKSGQIGAEFVLIALAKVNVAKNGVIYAWLGKKAYKLNEDMTRASRDLENMSPSDPRYYATLQRVQADTREGVYSQNMITGDMQKVAQDISSTLESVHSMIGLINQTRREIINRVGAR